MTAPRVAGEGRPAAANSARALAFPMWIAYVFFVIYGSLVPLDFRPFPLEQAWAMAQKIPMYTLGADSRADWIANGVLYIPLGFLTAHLLMQRGSAAGRIPRLLLAGLLSCAIAVGVEFAQFFFPPRTVSLNDLVAEGIGSVAGLLLAARYSQWLNALVQALFGDRERLTLRLLEAYLVGYLAFSLFPYDFLLSGAELAQKLRGNHCGWLIAGDHGGLFRITLTSMLELILTMPFGLFIGYRSTRRSISYWQVALVGILLGGSLELAQLFTYTGISQGLSVLTRCLGACAGLALWHRRADWSAQRLRRSARPYGLLLGISYLALLLFVNGWFTHQWDGAGPALSNLGELRFMPFYYHYYSSEAHALVSLAVTCIAYLPIGLLVWTMQGTPRHALLVALSAATVVETGKLFIAGRHPDPTNLLLATVSAWATVHLLGKLTAVVATEGPDEEMRSPAAQVSPPARQAPARGVARPRPGLPPSRTAYAVLLVSLAFCAYWTATFPAYSTWVFGILVACAATVWSRPSWLVAVVTAALPVFDLAPWSGRFFFDEFDLLLIVVLAVGNVRIPRVADASRQRRGAPFFALCFALLAASFAISAIRGMLPWPPLDANAFTNYFSAFNALRIVKGVVWALLLLGLTKRQVAAGIDAYRPLAWGLVSGLTLTVAVICWERIAFSGLFNFASDYRVTGPFSAMHTGGAYIECFLSTAVPFLTLLVLRNTHWGIRLLATALLLTTTYALMVTFSRNGYMAFGTALTIILFFALFRSTAGRRQYAILATGLGVALLAVALPVFTGQFAQSRMSTLDKDYEVRQRHWRDALDMRAPGWLTALFGMGLGRYPESHYLLSRENERTGSYQIKSDAGNRHLRLVSGSSLYVEQLVSMNPGQVYTLKIDVRANQPNASLTVPICEKWLLASYNCSWNLFKLEHKIGVWRHFEAAIGTEQFRADPWYSRRPIKLALYNGTTNAAIDVDNLRLEDAAGDNLLSNGDFSQDLDRWFFSTDSHLPWHIKSLPTAVLFDQGWFGALSAGLFALLAILHAGRRAWQGNLHAASTLAAFVAFLVVGLFDTLIDAPRFLLLLLLLGGYCGFGYDSRGEER